MADLEKPTIAEPIVEPTVDGTEVKAAEDTVIDTDALLKRLDKANIKTAQQLDGKIAASQEAGRLANMVGEYRKEKDISDRRIADLEQAMKMPPAEPNYYDENQPIDIKAEMREVIRTEREEERKQTLAAQRHAAKIWQGIQTNKHYGLVKDKWETKLKDPSFMMDIQSGTVNVSEEFNNMVLDEQTEMLRESHKTITTLQKGSVPSTPHVEGDAHLPGVPTPTNTEQETVTKLKEKVAKGGRLTEEEEMAGLMATISSPTE